MTYVFILMTVFLFSTLLSKSSFLNCNKNILIAVKFTILMYTACFIKYILIVVQPISKTLHLVKLKLCAYSTTPHSLLPWKPLLYFLSLNLTPLINLM